MEDFRTVKMFYPNECRKSLAAIGIDPGIFNWFVCGQRIYDALSGLYYLNVSNIIQFYEEDTGLTYTAKGKQNVRLVILSDSYNKGVLCSRYGILCGCNSKRDVLSTECNLVSSKENIRSNFALSRKMGFDGFVVKHDALKKKLNCYDNPVCQNATFHFEKTTLVPVENASRCFMVNYSKKNNECIRATFPDFPSVSQIDEMVQREDCLSASKVLYSLFNTYIKIKTSE